MPEATGRESSRQRDGNRTPETDIRSPSGQKPHQVEPGPSDRYCAGPKRAASAAETVRRRDRPYEHNHAPPNRKAAGDHGDYVVSRRVLHRHCRS